MTSSFYSWIEHPKAPVRQDVVESLWKLLSFTFFSARSSPTGAQNLYFCRRLSPLFFSAPLPCPPEFPRLHERALLLPCFSSPWLTSIQSQHCQVINSFSTEKRTMYDSEVLNSTEQNRGMHMGNWELETLALPRVSTVMGIGCIAQKTGGDIQGWRSVYGNWWPEMILRQQAVPPWERAIVSSEAGKKAVG